MREMTHEDFGALSVMFRDADVMYAYEHTFDDCEINDWIGRQITRYKNGGFGLRAVIFKKNEELIGQCGLTVQNCNGRSAVEVGYLFCKKYWHNGYATEAAVACKKYAFGVLGVDEVYSVIRDGNIASQQVAKRNGMTPKEKLTKYYYGIYMPHTAFSASK